jgi:hypothetical protein
MQEDEMNVLDEREIETRPVAGSYEQSRAWAQDAQRRGRIAEQQNSAFFADPAHQDRVSQTQAIVQQFFGGARTYVNQRGINRRPFTVVKVERPLFPNHLTRQQREDQLYAPLRALKVEVVFAKGSNSYLFRIR